MKKLITKLTKALSKTNGVAYTPTGMIPIDYNLNGYIKND